jgi:hypothetical protein
MNLVTAEGPFQTVSDPMSPCPTISIMAGIGETHRNHPAAWADKPAEPCRKK